MRQIFLSYAREDAELAEKLREDLSDQGLAPWLDTRDLTGGEDWEQRITSEIESSDFFVAIFSEVSTKSRGFFHREVQLALKALDRTTDEELDLIPVRADDCSPQHQRLKQRHWIDLFPDYATGLQDLLAAILARTPTRHNVNRGAAGSLFATILRLTTENHRAAIELKLLLEAKHASVSRRVTTLKETLSGNSERLLRLRDKVDMFASEELAESTRLVAGFGVLCQLLAYPIEVDDNTKTLDSEYKRYIDEYRPRFLALIQDDSSEEE